MRVVNRETLLLQAGSGWAVAEVSINDYVSEIVAFHISPRPQPHLIDYQDETLAGCRCTSAISTFNAPSVDAHYAYWLQDTSSLFSPNPVAPQAATTVCRLDLTTPQPHITWWSPPSNVTTFAITGGRLFAGLGIGDAPTAGVGELAPRWTTTPAPAPALQPTPCPT